MNHFKKHKVVMLPTDQKLGFPFWIDTSSPKIPLYSNTGENKDNWNYNVAKPQHLYILSDEPIKENDWVYDEMNNKVYQANDVVIHNMKSLQYPYLKKVIATTDILFTATKDMVNPYLPSLSQSFIETIIERYNSGDPISEILVEYSPAKICDNPMESDFAKLKVNTDNTINIKLSKENWSREEVIALCKSAYCKGHYNGLFKEGEPILDNKWIEEKL